MPRSAALTYLRLLLGIYMFEEIEGAAPEPTVRQAVVCFREHFPAVDGNDLGLQSVLLPDLADDYVLGSFAWVGASARTGKAVCV